ncbi:MAG: MFS transporter [Actinomycetales bacterium]|jgi:MFS family permease|nr:MFS transporter [Actinomycetales bacterium]
MSVLGDLRTVAVHRDFRKLFAVRLVSQCGDGMFQAGLATLFFFQPENMATAGQVAAAFTVLLLPFTVVAPFAGPLLDRWRRRQVLLWGNLVRVPLALVLAVLMATVGVGPVVYVLALVTLGVNRFLLAALSAALPHVVPRAQLLMANTITPTLGAVSAVVGAGIGVVLSRVTPEGAVRDAVVLTVAGLFFGAASALALRLGRDQLGPEERGLPIGQAIAATLRDLADGARWLVRRGTPALGLGVMGVHRFLYGVNFIALILMSRNLLVDPTDADAGLAMFALLAGVSLAGNGVAIVLTPIAHERMRPATWVAVCLGIGVVSQGLLAASHAFAVVAVSAVLLGLSVQGAKIAVDTIVQRDTDDDYRGRAFSLYDMLYNAAFVGAAALAAVVLPDAGWSALVFAVLAVVYALTALGYRAANDRAEARLPA